MVKKGVKRASTPRPYNNWTMSESEVQWMILKKIRLLTSWWKPKQLVIKNAKWICEHCKQYKPPLKADHTNPVVPLENWPEEEKVFWINWSSYIERAFIEVGDGWQALCKDCHDIKTKAENKERKVHRDAKKATQSSLETP